VPFVGTWSAHFEDLKNGVGCSMCEDGRPDESEFGLRVMAGSHSDSYLQREGFHRGYVVVIHRGDHHVTEMTDLPDADAIAYWREVLRVATAVTTVFRPVKMNLMLLGNALPHLHTHVVPRYEDDADAGGPPDFAIEGARDETELRTDAERLREALTAGGER
jgi:diadenosine tetraphosphate (Ap4A) HIT family hydrolase